MKVLAAGHEPRKWIGKCSRCQTIYEAEEGELSITNGDYRNGFSDYAWANCDFCVAKGQRGKDTIYFVPQGTPDGARLLNEVQARIAKVLDKV